MNTILISLDFFDSLKNWSWRRKFTLLFYIFTSIPFHITFSGTSKYSLNLDVKIYPIINLYCTYSKLDLVFLPQFSDANLPALQFSSVQTLTTQSYYRPQKLRAASQNCPIWNSGFWFLQPPALPPTWPPIQVDSDIYNSLRFNKSLEQLTELTVCSLFRVTVLL
jgi:hypothetical protein